MPSRVLEDMVVNVYSTYTLPLERDDVDRTPPWVPGFTVAVRFEFDSTMLEVLSALLNSLKFSIVTVNCDDVADPMEFTATTRISYACPGVRPLRLSVRA